MLDSAQRVFSDETTVSIKYGSAEGAGPRGTSVIGSVPLGAWETLLECAGRNANVIAETWTQLARVDTGGRSARRSDPQRCAC
jgi:hypothetical protein